MWTRRCAAWTAFNTEKFDCYHCHAGTTFTTSFQSANTPPPARDMRNTGLYNLDGKGAYPADNTGLYDFTQFSNDMGKFKVPTLAQRRAHRAPTSTTAAPPRSRRCSRPTRTAAA